MSERKALKDTKQLKNERENQNNAVKYTHIPPFVSGGRAGLFCALAYKEKVHIPKMSKYLRFHLFFSIIHLYYKQTRVEN